MPTLFAYDYSGSTGGCPIYHDISQKLYAQEAKRGEVTVLLWDSCAQVATAERLAEINARREGNGGTEPSVVADHIKKNDIHDRLVLITDGQTSNNSVDKATTTLGPEWKFASVEVHLINTGGTVNMSVSCPFTRNSPHVVNEYERDGNMKPIIVVSPEDLKAIELVETIDTVEAYEANQEALEKVVRARTMGTTGDPSLRDSILAMKKRIIAAAAKLAGKDTAVADMIKAVKASAPEALQLAEVVTNNYFASLNGGWSGSISRLVGMCEGALRGAFDLSGVNAAIQGDRARRAEEAEDVGAVDVAVTDAPAGFECPITLDNESDVLLLIASEGEPVLAGLDKTVVNYLADCPLNALNNPEVVDRIKAKLDHPVSVVSVQQAAASGAPITVSPFTSRHIAGGIALGCNRDQVKCTTNTIAQMVAGGKLLGSPDLWFAVIWRIIESGAIPHLSPLVDQFRAQMKWRCENNQASMSLSGLPELPTTRVPLGVAAWYVAAASALSLTGKDEPLRAHITHIEPLMSIVELVNYSLPPGIPEYIQRLRTMLGMLSSVKKDRHLLPAIARALYQNSISVNVSNVADCVKELETVTQFVPVDGPATEASLAKAIKALPAKSRTLPPKDLFALASIVDPSLAAGDVTIPFDFSPVAERKWEAAKPVVEWRYGLEPKNGVASVKICPLTCRPFYQLKDGKVWKDAAAEHYGIPAEELLAINRNYGDFVAKYRKYPNFDELVTFSYNRVVKGKSGKTTLPSIAEELVQMALREYAEVAATLAPEDFRRRYLSTVTIEDRLPVETKKE